MAEGGGGGVIHVLFRPGVRQAAAGNALAQQHIRHDVAAHVAALGDEQDGVDAGDGFQGGGVDNTADVQQQDDLLVVLAQCGEQIDFRLGQLIVPLFGTAVAALAGIPAQHIDGNIAFRLLEGSQGLGDEMLIEYHKEIRDADGGGPLVNIGHVSTEFLLNDPILLCQPFLGGDGEARCFQTLLHGDVEPAVDLAAAGAALYRGPGAVAVKRHLLGAGQRQGAVIFQQHHALAGNPTDEIAVGLLTGSDLGGGGCVIVNHGWDAPFRSSMVDLRKFLCLLYKKPRRKSMDFGKILKMPFPL